MSRLVAPRLTIPSLGTSPSPRHRTTTLAPPARAATPPTHLVTAATAPKPFAREPVDLTRPPTGSRGWGLSIDTQQVDCARPAAHGTIHVALLASQSGSAASTPSSHGPIPLLQHGGPSLSRPVLSSTADSAKPTVAEAAWQLSLLSQEQVATDHGSRRGSSSALAQAVFQPSIQQCPVLGERQPRHVPPDPVHLEQPGQTWVDLTQDEPLRLCVDEEKTPTPEMATETLQEEETPTEETASETFQEETPTQEIAALRDAEFLPQEFAPKPLQAETPNQELASEPIRKVSLFREEREGQLTEPVAVHLQWAHPQQGCIQEGPPQERLPQEGPRGFANPVVGLGGALSSFGAPNEWWHDSIILGRLSALAMNYAATKTLRRPWSAWQLFVHSIVKKRALLYGHQQRLALRGWHRRVLVHGRRIGPKLPLLEALSRLPLVALKLAWERLSHAVTLRRDLQRRVYMLGLLKLRSMNNVARTHYHRSLLRWGLGSFWIVAQTRSNSDSEEARSGHRLRQRLFTFAEDKAESVECPSHHIQLVSRRAWHRWRFSTQMWLSPEEHRAKEVQAWLAGDVVNTPRGLALELSGPVAEPRPWRKRPAAENEHEHAGLLLLGSRAPLQVPFPGISEGSTEQLPLSQGRYALVRRMQEQRQLQKQQQQQQQQQQSPYHSGLERQEMGACNQKLHLQRQHQRRWTPPRKFTHMADASGNSPCSSAASSPKGRSSTTVGFGLAAEDPDKGKNAEAVADSSNPLDYWAMRSRIAPLSAARHVELRQRC